MYQEEGIQINQDWFSSDPTHEEEVNYCEDADQPKQQSAINGPHSDDEWIETTESEQCANGNMDTLLALSDFRDDGQHALQIAPGEKNYPIGLYLDKDAEEKAFPVLFAGQRRTDERKNKVTYGTICKSEMRNVDRRFATCVPNIFFKLKKASNNSNQRNGDNCAKKNKMTYQLYNWTT